jgi:hypothetical protein
VSRRHAALTVDGQHAWLEDLGSTEGTFVNGQRVRGRRELRWGDVLEFAVVRMRYEGVGPATGGARFDISRQHGEAIINVGGNYYQQQRDGLLREIAATRTRGRRLVGFGAVVFLAGFGVFAAGVLGFISQVASDISSGNPRPPSSPFGPLVFGIPSGLLGWVLAMIGLVLIVLGIVQHVVATARRRRVDRAMPL